MSLKVDDAVIVDYKLLSHGLPGYGTVVEPGIYNTETLWYVRIRSNYCASLERCVKGCDGFPIKYVELKPNTSTSECSCSLAYVMANGCPTSRGSACPKGKLDYEN